MAKQVTLYIAAELHKAFKIIALEEGRTFSSVVTDAMTNYIKAINNTLDNKVNIKNTDESSQGGFIGNASISDTLNKYGDAISEIKDEIEKLKFNNVPAVTDIPQAPGVADAMDHALKLIFDAGAKGLTGTVFQDLMKKGGFTLGPSRTATSTLKRQKKIKQIQNRWVLYNVVAYSNSHKHQE